MKIQASGVNEMAQQSRAHTALAEDQRWVLSITRDGS